MAEGVWEAAEMRGALFEVGFFSLSGCACAAMRCAAAATLRFSAGASDGTGWYGAPVGRMREGGKGGQNTEGLKGLEGSIGAVNGWREN